MLAPPEKAIIVWGWLLIVRLAAEFIIVISAGGAGLILICFWNCCVDRSLISISLLEYISFHQASPRCDVVSPQLPPLRAAQQHTGTLRWVSLGYSQSIKCVSVWKRRECDISHQLLAPASLAYKQRWFLCHNWALQIRGISGAAAGPVRLPSHQHLRTGRGPGVTSMADDNSLSRTAWWRTAWLKQWHIQLLSEQQTQHDHWEFVKKHSFREERKLNQSQVSPQCHPVSISP